MDMWYSIDNSGEVASPALLVYPDRIEQNIQEMIRLAGSVDSLRPHVKTHKMAEIVKLQMSHGIYKFKSATISETEMVAKCGAKDILLAIQPVGPNIDRFFKLKEEFPECKFSCIVDSEKIIHKLSEIAVIKDCDVHVWLDINVGMNRTGVSPDQKGLSLYKLMPGMPNLIAEGLHVYDGHLHDMNYSVRQAKCNDSFSPILNMIDELKVAGIEQIKIVAGGSPTFPIHASRVGVECSPGTTLLWDFKSSSSFPDMNFLHAAVLLMRVISKPAADLLCLDLGHKAIASEMPQPRLEIPGIKKFTIVGHNEEHMVIRTSDADSFETGDLLYGIPWHICPTVDRYDFVITVNDNIAAGQWAVEARKRKITI